MTHDALAVRHVIDRTLRLGVRFHPGAAIVQRQAGPFQNFRHFLLGFVLGLAQRHLHARMGVDLAFAGRFDRQVDHVLVIRHDRGLRAIGLRRRHAAERLHRQHHVGQVFVRVIDVLGDFQVAFAAARARVVERMSQALQFVLVGEVMRDVAQRADDLVIFVLEDGFRQFQLRDFVAEAPLDLGALVETPQRRQHRALFEPLEVLVLLHDLVDHVHDPGADGLHQHLRAFALQEVEHVEVAVAFGGLRPEFAGDLHDGLYAQRGRFRSR